MIDRGEPAIFAANDDMAHRRMGEAAADMLIDRVMGRNVAVRGPIPTDLVVRRSSGPAPGRS